MTVLLVDGNSLAHRAFHGAANGSPTGAFVASIIASALTTTSTEHGPYAAAVLCFDGKGNARRKVDAGYKAGRKPAPEGLYAQMDLAKTIFSQAGFTVTTMDGWEADDLLACGAVEALGIGHDAHILTSDKDMLGLIRAGVVVLRIKTGIHDQQPYDSDRVHAEFGVPAARYTLFSSFRGDQSDNLPGVDGIGKKTAAKLIIEHDTIAGIYAALGTMTPGLRSKLENGREALAHNLAMMTPNLDLHAGVDTALACSLDAGIVRSVFEAEDAASGGRRLARALGGAPQPAPQPKLF